MEVNQTIVADQLESVETWNPVKLFLRTYASLLLIVGIMGNIICGVIMGGNKANRTSTRLLMVILAIADSAVLLTAVLRYWCIIMLNWDPRNDGSISCKLHVFAVAFSTDFAVGALCAIAVERLLVVAFPHRANNVVTVTSACLGMTSFALLVALKNSIHFWMMGLNKPVQIINNRTTPSDSNGPAEGKPIQLHCGSHPSYSTVFRIFVKSDMISFAVLPYVILFSSNVYIYLKLRKQQKVLKQTKNRSARTTQTCATGTSKLLSAPAPTERSAMSGQTCASCPQPVPRRPKRRPESAIKLLTALTLIHVGCTLPGTLFTFLTFYFPDYFRHMDKETHEAIKVPLVMLIFTNNAINFFGYYASCASFRESFQRLLIKLCRCLRQNAREDRQSRWRSALFLRCCNANAGSTQPDRVLIVAPKPCSTNNGDQMVTCQQTFLPTEQVEE
ncbi:Kappa-type opioid receptor [Fasciolopsis buskii]|uniref:Kappa-type opioid receptor n=1 Tax=Fasciolopsis buskii TaxID=27845 RepID=A0A8E0VFI5_9TREM|nr:Kappa-type opioid receptor [Fasciolopsis buski]